MRRRAASSSSVAELVGEDESRAFVVESVVEEDRALVGVAHAEAVDHARPFDRVAEVAGFVNEVTQCQHVSEYAATHPYL